MLHFCNSDDQPEGDAIFKIKEMANCERERFKSMFDSLCTYESNAILERRAESSSDYVLYMSQI
jgi:hypothetical protein